MLKNLLKRLVTFPYGGNITPTITKAEESNLTKVPITEPNKDELLDEEDDFIDLENVVEVVDDLGDGIKVQTLKSLENNEDYFCYTIGEKEFLRAKESLQRISGIEIQQEENRLRDQEGKYIISVVIKKNKQAFYSTTKNNYRFNFSPSEPIHLLESFDELMMTGSENIGKSIYTLTHHLGQRLKLGKDYEKILYKLKSFVGLIKEFKRRHKIHTTMVENIVITPSKIMLSVIFRKKPKYYKSIISIEFPNL